MANSVIFLLTLGLFSLAQSDVGYRYNVPVSSYDAPFGSVGNLNNERKYYHVQNQQATGSLPVAPSTHLLTPVNERTSFTASGHPQTQLSATSSLNHDKPATFNVISNERKEFVSKENTAGNIPLDGRINTVSINSVNIPLDGRVNTVSTNIPLGGRVNTVSGHSGNIPLDGRVNTAQNQAVDSRFSSSFSSQNSRQVDVQKHLYFFSAPEEPEDVRPKLVAPQVPVKKNVKILFIKAPTYSAAPINIPVLPQNEEKTLVYVLVKKPDESSVVIPTAEPTRPSKPEVYFIRYKTHKEAQEAIANLQQNGDAGRVGGVSAIDSNGFVADSRSQDGGRYHSGVNENVNIVSKYSSDSGKSVSQGAVSTQATPTGYGSGQLNVYGGSSGVDARFSSGHQPSQHSFSSDEISHFGGLSGNIGNDYAGSTTASSVNLPTASSKISQEVNVKQEYLPPRNS